MHMRLRVLPIVFFFRNGSRCHIRSVITLRLSSNPRAVCPRRDMDSSLRAWRRSILGMSRGWSVDLALDAVMVAAVAAAVDVAGVRVPSGSTFAAS